MSLAAVLVVVIIAITPLINHLLHPPSVDLAVSGGLTGRMKTLSDWHGFPASCVTQNEKKIWFGFFAGTLGASHVVFSLILTPYDGPGTYTDKVSGPGSLTLQRIRVLLSTIPDSAPHGIAPPVGGTAYSTHPGPGYVRLQTAVGTQDPQVTQATVTMNSDDKSGRIDAFLTYTSVTAGEPVRVTGSFNCGTLTTH